jgi:hypothetical protein
MLVSAGSVFAQAENQYLRDPMMAAMGDGRQTRDKNNGNRSFD